MSHMSFFKRFRKKEETPVERKVETDKAVSDLKRICGGDRELYDALYKTMFLDPREIGMSSEEAAKRARELEKEDDKLRARIWYRVAGGLAMYEGNVEKVKEYFQKYAELSGESYSILDRIEEAVAKAQEFYRECLKEVEEE